MSNKVVELSILPNLRLLLNAKNDDKALKIVTVRKDLRQKNNNKPRCPTTIHTTFDDYMNFMETMARN